VAQATCLRTAVVDALDSSGPAAAQNLLDTWSKAVSPQPFPCHAIAHFLGRSVYAYASEKDATLAELPKGPVNCRDGYVHGLLEGVGLHTTGEDLIKTLGSVCPKIAVDDLSWTWCRHALGHAASMNKQEDISNAVDVCLLLQDTYRSDCVGGVLMTYGGRTLSFDWSQEEFDLESGEVIFQVDKNERSRLCTNLPAGSQLGCWEYLWMLYDDEGPLEEESAAYRAVCPSAGSNQARELCGAGLGKLLMNAELPDDPSDILGRCGTDPVVEGACAYGVLASYVGVHVASAGSAENYRSVCPTQNDRLTKLCLQAESKALEILAN